MDHEELIERYEFIEDNDNRTQFGTSELPAGHVAYDPQVHQGQGISHVNGRGRIGEKWYNLWGLPGEIRSAEIDSRTRDHCVLNVEMRAEAKGSPVNKDYPFMYDLEDGDIVDTDVSFDAVTDRVLAEYTMELLEDLEGLIYVKENHKYKNNARVDNLRGNELELAFALSPEAEDAVIDAYESTAPDPVDFIEREELKTWHIEELERYVSRVGHDIIRTESDGRRRNLGKNHDTSRGKDDVSSSILRDLNVRLADSAMVGLSKLKEDDDYIKAEIYRDVVRSFPSETVPEERARMSFLAAGAHHVRDIVLPKGDLSKYARSPESKLYRTDDHGFDYAVTDSSAIMRDAEKVLTSTNAPSDIDRGDAVNVKKDSKKLVKNYVKTISKVRKSFDRRADGEILPLDDPMTPDPESQTDQEFMINQRTDNFKAYYVLNTLIEVASGISERSWDKL